MALKRYLSTLVFPTSPRRSRTASSESPVSARSPIEDLRDFWKATFEESLKQGERYREDALARMRAQRGLLSDAEVWDLQTMNDGLVVERDDLSDFAQSPERLSFEVVSRASRYKSRAQSLYSEVREVVRRSRASIESAQMRASEYRHAEQRGAVTRHADVSDSLPCGSSAIHSRSQQRAEGHYAGAELCGSPPACNSSSSSSSYSRFPLASSDRHAALIGSVSKPHGSSWETTIDDENYGIRQVSSGPGTNETILPRSEKQGVDIGQWAADIGKHMGGVAQRRGAYERRSTQSDLSELSEFSPGPPTPHSSPQSSPPSADLSTSPAFLKKLDDALKGLNVSLTGLDVGSVEDHSQVFVDTSFTMHRTSPTHLLSRGKTHMLRGPRDPIRATQSQLNPVLPLPFRPVPDLRRAASQPQLQSRAPRERLPVLFTREDIEALRVMTSDLASSTSPPTDDDEDIEDEEDLFKDDCTVETASVVVQPYGHSRANTTDRPIICSPEGFPLRTPPLNWFEGVKY
ncbi:uncharacterized protein B0H18DRAFT_1025105 [Fomitopsis serialis]|uniref:uncharacterized protein n=1 Tax=Fomitopsis serialis TaxID=139415 RepID=UPI0020072B93|nr:uncharacterized protein B0H18DRAFT_1049442 [Neoantrodia serialis]XP_047889984.1 uncharacterized protein B0H18DRAFT_1025105 [Neoantrodia serialis]KAH9913305.1 hypothetical protein B0H18DRAFT_1049442 [Neoantrodia serialis]KAH9920112.1 hypothetical protein B0H18DRAFT_1025105 [Neoantrodia serialis]